MSERFPIDDLQRIICAETDGDIALATGFCRRTVQRWRRDGLTPIIADRAAIRAGYHPANIWPHWQ
jgi:hypothetical protein